MFGMIIRNTITHPKSGIPSVVTNLWDVLPVLGIPIYHHSLLQIFGMWWREIVIIKHKKVV